MTRMPSPVLSVTAAPLATVAADALVLGTRPGSDGGIEVIDHDEPALAGLADTLRMLGHTGAIDETVRVPAPTGLVAATVLAIGLGRGEGTPEALRSAAGTAARALAMVSRVALALPAASPEAGRAILEGAAMGAYRFTGYRRTEPGPATAEFVLLTEHEDAESMAAAAAISADAVALVRDLVNTPPNDLYPATFVERARAAAAGLPLTIEEWGPEELAAGGFGGILGVGQGSSRPPRLLAVRYAGTEGAPHLAIVGKGITFDSGGLSLKPATAMVGMKYDMTGAATALAAVIAAARSAVPTRVTAWLCLAENLPSSTAMRPNDVLTMRGGTTVEVLNTDAEGRLVMADGLAVASEERPDAIVDVATLTGAARVALGERYAGLMGDDPLVEEVRAAAVDTGELVWPMPLPTELRPLLKSDVADIANAKPGSTAAGMLLAGVFLREFVGRTSDEPDAPRIPWAHLDIAGPANNPGSPFGYTPKGPSGVTVRLLLRLAERLAAK